MDNEVAKLSKVFELTPEDSYKRLLIVARESLQKMEPYQLKLVTGLVEALMIVLLLKNLVQKILLIGVRLINLSILINLKSYGKKLTLILQRKTGIFLVFMLAHMTNITYLLR